MNRENTLLFYFVAALLVVFVIPNIFYSFAMPVEDYDNLENYPSEFANAIGTSVDNTGIFSPDFEEPEMGTRNNNEYTKPEYNEEKQTLMNGAAASNWIAPAWDPERVLTSDDDAEQDTRMIYNKCSLSCCSPSYPSSLIKEDPSVFDANGKRKYVASKYTCQNSCGTGCVCMTEKQSKNFINGTY